MTVTPVPAGAVYVAVLAPMTVPAGKNSTKATAAVGVGTGVIVGDAEGEAVKLGDAVPVGAAVGLGLGAGV